MGGRVYPWNITDTLYAYSYNCNQWINLMSDGMFINNYFFCIYHIYLIFSGTEKVGPFPSQTYAQAMTVEPDGDAVYVIGGWGIDTQSTVLRIELPVDLCNLWPKKSSCLGVPGCGYCANKFQEDIISEQCHTNTKECQLDPVSNGKI